MSKTLEKRLEIADVLALSRLESEAFNIIAKYSNDGERLYKEGSEHEKAIVLRWGQPHLKELYTDYMNVFFCSAMKLYFEERIYPRVLPYESNESNSESENIILGLDNLFIETVYPELWHRFIEELDAMKKSDFTDSGISQDLADEFKKAHVELEAVKVKARDRIRKQLTQYSGELEESEKTESAK